MFLLDPANVSVGAHQNASWKDEESKIQIPFGPAHVFVGHHDAPGKNEEPKAQMPFESRVGFRRGAS
jgi:hypothetical protein